MIIRISVFVFAFALCLAACDDDAQSPLKDNTAFEQARARWEATGFDSYEFSQTRGCYCLLGGESVRLIVLRDSIVSGVTRTDSTALTADQLTWYKTVDQLFDFIEGIDPKQVASFSAHYDATYGYPTWITVDYSTAIADDEIEYSSYLVRPLR